MRIEDINRLEISEMKMVQMIRAKTLKDKIRNE